MTPATDAATRARDIAIKHALPGIYDGISTHATRRGDADGRPYMVALREAITEAASQPREGDGRTYPELLSSAEQKAVLERAERLWKDLQANNLGGFSGINRPFYIVAEFKSVIEQFGHRDVGLRWSKDDLDAAALTQRPPEQAGAVPAGWKLVPVEPTEEQIWEALRTGIGMQSIYRAMLSAAPTPPDAGPGEIPAGMVRWDGRYGPPRDVDHGKPVMRRNGEMTGTPVTGNVWLHLASHPGADIIAYTPKAPPQTPPDAGIGSDGARENFPFPVEGTHEYLAGKLRGEAFLLSDSVDGHRKRIDVRTMEKVEMPRDVAVLIGAMDRAAKLMREAADALATQPGDGGQS